MTPLDSKVPPSGHPINLRGQSFGMESTTIPPMALISITTPYGNSTDINGTIDCNTTVVNGTNVTTCTNGTDNNTSGGDDKKETTDDPDANIDGFNLNDIDPTFGIFETLPGLKKLFTFSGPLNFT